MVMVQNHVTKEQLELSKVLNEKLTRLIKFSYLYLLIRFRLKYRQVSIVTHTDFDGAISASILLQKFPYSKVYFASSKSIHKVLYVIKRVSPPEIPHDIYILDIKPADLYSTRIIKAIKSIRQESLVEIYWIDHHNSKNLDEIGKYVNLLIDSSIPHAAYIVFGKINSTSNANTLLNIIRGVRTSFTKYWGAVLRVALKHFRNSDLRVKVLKALSKFQKNDLTDGLFERSMVKNREDGESIKVERIFMTGQGYRFSLIKHTHDELYQEVRDAIRRQQLDFLLVSFEDGTFSAYKRRNSSVDLTALFNLVGGKGHLYAFHFDPQMRITDEFFRPLNESGLLKKIQEVI